MNAKLIIERLNIALSNIKKDDFISNFPIIIKDLQYIYFELNNEIKKLKGSEQFKYGVEIDSKIIEFFAELTKKYIKIKYNTEIKIESTQDYSLSLASGGYDNKSDVIKYSPFGILLGKKNNSSYLQTFLHESKHKLQHNAYSNIDIMNIFENDPNTILLAKEIVCEKLSTVKNKDFYVHNYNVLYTETDAEKFSLDALKTIILDLFLLYTEYAEYNKIEVNSEVFEQTMDIQQEISKHSEILEENDKKEGRLNPLIQAEISGQSEIKSSYSFQHIPVDRLIELDKCIKQHPEFQQEIPILRLIFNGDTPKTYEEIIADKKILLSNYPNKSKQINEVYDYIIVSDPILYLTHLIINNQNQLVIQFIQNHPTILSEYSYEIETIKEKYQNSEVWPIITSNNNKKK